MNKEEMIRMLVAHSVQTALSEPKHYWLNELFEKGFTGYRNLARGELMRELQMRGLDEECDGGDAPDPEDELADYDDCDIDLPLRARAE